MISRIINWVKIPTLSGIALSRFYRKRYDEALPLFEKIIKIDPNNKKIEYIYACLGRSYLSTEKYADALASLENAYSLYSKRIYPIEDNFERKEYMELLKAYRTVLQYFGNDGLAKEIDYEFNEKKYPGEGSIDS